MTVRVLASLPERRSRSFLGPALALTSLLAVACGSDDSNGAGGAGGSAGLGGTGGTIADGGGGDAQADSATDAGSNTVGPTVLTDTAPSAGEAEPHVAATASGRVGVAWISREGLVNKIGYRLSDDDGVTFGTIQFIQPPSGMSLGDPIVTADGANNLFLAWGAVRRDAAGNRIEGRLFSARSAPGETAFAAPVEVTNPADDALYDMPRVAAKPGGGLVYSYLQYPKGPLTTGAIKVSTSSDGAAWQAATVASGGGFRNLAFPCFSAETGRVWVKFFDQTAGIVLQWSDDGGATFPAANRSIIQEPAEGPSVGLVTPGCAAKGDEVWVMYSISAGLHGPQDNDYLSKIRLAHSGDGGANIDWRADVHDPSAGSVFLYPEIVGEPGGALNITYYAGTGVANPSGSYRHARSANGKDFAPSTIVSAPITVSAARGALTWLGDYIGLTWQSGNLYTAFGDNSSGASHISFFRAQTPTP